LEFKIQLASRWIWKPLFCDKKFSGLKYLKLSLKQHLLFVLPGTVNITQQTISKPE